jgi:hypothetical protein
MRLITNMGEVERLAPQDKFRRVLVSITYELASLVG